MPCKQSPESRWLWPESPRRPGAHRRPPSAAAPAQRSGRPSQARRGGACGGGDRRGGGSGGGGFGAACGQAGRDNGRGDRRKGGRGLGRRRGIRGEGRGDVAYTAVADGARAAVCQGVCVCVCASVCLASCRWLPSVSLDRRQGDAGLGSGDPGRCAHYFSCPYLLLALGHGIQDRRRAGGLARQSLVQGVVHVPDHVGSPPMT